MLLFQLSLINLSRNACYAGYLTISQDNPLQSKDCYQWGLCIKHSVPHQRKSNKIAIKLNWFQLNSSEQKSLMQFGYRTIEHKTFLSVQCVDYNLGKQNQMVISACKKNLNSSLPLEQAVLNNVPAIKCSKFGRSILYHTCFLLWAPLCSMTNSITLFRPIELEKWIFDFIQFIFLVCEFQFILMGELHYAPPPPATYPFT